MAADLDIEFLANDERAIAESVLAALDDYTDAFFAVAYGTHSAFELLNARLALSQYLKAGRRLRVFFDADRHFTDPELITEIATFPGDVECRLFAPQARNRDDATRPTAFHSKVYYFERAGHAAAIVGSANFSPGGLRNNSEAAVCVRGSVDAPVFQSIRQYMERTWNSPHQIGVLENPGFLETYEAAYAAARRRMATLPIPPEAPVYQTSDDVAALRDAFAVGAEALFDGIVAYILGLTSGGWHSDDLRRRLVTVELRRGRLNRNRERDGEVFFEGVSERGFDQRECVRRDAERILTRLHRAFEALETADSAEIEQRADLSYRINMRFRHRSRIWRAVVPELRAAGKNRRYLCPARVELQRESAGRSFLQGYMDLRTRIAATDSLPPPLPLMRIAVSIGSHAPANLPDTLRELMAAEFACAPDKINLLHGASRRRESIIRIDARLIPTNFLESHWQRIVVEDFRAFNERLVQQ